MHHLTRVNFAALIAASAHVLGVSGSPFGERRADSTLSSASSSAPTAALVETTISGKATTIEVALPTATDSKAATASTTGASSAGAASTVSSASSTASSTSVSSLLPSSDFAACRDDNAKPFCLPANNTDVYYGESYYVTWNPSKFPPASSIIVLLNWFNDTKKQVWSSGPLENKIGATAVEMKQEWLQGYTAYNLTFFAQQYDSATDKSATYYNGPTVQLKAKPPQHYQAPPPTSPPNELGLKVGLPVSLGFVALVVVGLYFGMRKQRRIGLGNVMGRNRGYGGRKSRRQRLGLGSRKDDISLQERELLREPQYRDDPPPAPRPISDASLGSLADSPTEGRNAFREEIERQQTGGRR